MSLLAKCLMASGTIAETIEAVSKRFGFTADELRFGGREASLANARHIAAWLLRERGLSYPEIGRALSKDHSTMIHAVRKVEVERAMDPAVAALLEQLKVRAA
jgi:chromosomal replication initiator protein